LTNFEKDQKQLHVTIIDKTKRKDRKGKKAKGKKQKIESKEHIVD